MNVFGVGAPELIAIFVIMLVFAGPKRMIHWAYLLGKHTAKFRQMWSQTVDLIQKEFDEAGVDVKLPKEPPTKKNFQKALSASFEPVTKPIQESLNEVNKDIATIKDVKKEVSKPVWSAKPKEQAIEPAHDSPKVADLGTWSSGKSDEPVQAETKGTASGMGTWSSYENKDE